MSRAGHALFFTLPACAFALFGGALRAGAFVLFFGPLISRFRAPRFFALFSRSSIFRAHTFAIIDFRSRNFVLVHLYMARTGQPGQDTQNRTARTKQAEQNRLNRTGRTGQAEHDRQNRTGRNEQSEHECLDRTYRT